jgi:hypothetical protein
MRNSVFVCLALMLLGHVHAAIADDIQITPERQSEGVSKTDKLYIANPQLGLTMPAPSSDHWRTFYEGGMSSPPPTPAGVSFFRSDAGFGLNPGPKGHGFDWYKIVYAQDQASKEGAYAVEIVLLRATCTPPEFAVVETDRFSRDGKLVSKAVYPVDKQKFLPILDDAGRMEAGKRTDPYTLLILHAGTCGMED